MKTLKTVLILLIAFTFIQCDDNSSSDPGGSTLNPQYAYITDGGDLKIIDVANPSAPTFVNNIAMNTSYFVSVSPDVAYVAQYDAIEPYVNVVNISNVNSLNSTPVAKNSATNFSILSDLYTILGTAYITDLYRGLNSIDTNTFSGPITTTNTGSDAVSVTKLGNFLYIIDQVNGLSQYNISTPGTPTYTGVNNNTDVDTSSYSNATFGQFHSWLENDGTYLYVANINDKKLKKFDATTLNLISEISIDGHATAFAIHNGFAYITTKAGLSPLQNSFDGIKMVNLSTMTVVADNSLSLTSGVALNGNYCYVTHMDGLHIFDISAGTLNFVSNFLQGKGNYIALGE
jgi:hypothetical protein